MGLPDDFNQDAATGGTALGIGGDLSEPYGGTTLSDSNRATTYNGSITQRCVSWLGLS